MKHFFLLTLLLTSIASIAQESPSGPSKSTPNAVTKAAVQAGILTCAARIQQLTQFVGFNSTAAAILMQPTKRPDEELFSVQLGVPAGADSASLVDLTFAPSPTNGCGATYQAISYWESACKSVAEKQFSSFKPAGKLINGIHVLADGQQAKVFLIDAGTKGCISVKKEVVN